MKIQIYNLLKNWNKIHDMIYNILNLLMNYFKLSKFYFYYCIFKFKILIYLSDLLYKYIKFYKFKLIFKVSLHKK